MVSGKLTKSVRGRPEAQRILAREVTRMVHGEEGLQAAERITESLFSGDISNLSETDLEQLKQDGLPSATIQLGRAGRSGNDSAVCRSRYGEIRQAGKRCPGVVMPYSLTVKPVVPQTT